MRSDTRACPHKFYQNGFENFRFGGQNIEMSWGQIQEHGPTSFTKPDLNFFDFEVKTLKCPEVKYKSPVTWCPKSKISKIRFSGPKIEWPRKRFNNKNNSNNKNNNNNNNNSSFSQASQTARVLGVIHTAQRMVSSQTPWTQAVCDAWEKGDKTHRDSAHRPAKLLSPISTFLDDLHIKGRNKVDCEYYIGNGEVADR